MSLKSSRAVRGVLILTTIAGCASAAELSVTVRDLAGKPLEDAVVFVTPVGRPLKSMPPAAPVVIDQVNKRFVPLVSIVRTGTEVNFPNSDNIRHSIYSFSQAKIFTTKLYSGKQAPPVVFDKPGAVALGCNIHDAMAAWVVVVDTPYFAKSSGDGIGRIKDLESGEYRLSVWYPQPKFEPQESQLHIAAANMSTEVRLDTSTASLPDIHAHAHAEP
jgi:plastocyanin